MRQIVEELSLEGWQVVSTVVSPHAGINVMEVWFQREIVDQPEMLETFIDANKDLSAAAQEYASYIARRDEQDVKIAEYVGIRAAFDVMSNDWLDELREEMGITTEDFAKSVGQWIANRVELNAAGKADE